MTLVGLATNTFRGAERREERNSGGGIFYRREMLRQYLFLRSPLHSKFIHAVNIGEHRHIAKKRTVYKIDI